VPSAWVFVSGMLAEAKVSPSFLKNPLILRDRVPSSFLRPELPPVSETRVSPLFEVRVPPVLIEERAASCPRPACLRFSRSLYLRLGFPICNPKELLSSNSNTYTYILTPVPLKTVELCYSYSSSLLHYNCCITITTTLHIVTYYSLHSCIYNNNSRSTYS